MRIPEESEAPMVALSNEKENSEIKGEYMKKDLLVKKEKIEASIVEKVQSLQVSPTTDPPFVTPLTTPLTTPMTTPHTSPVSKRKISGIVMDRERKHSYFCTKAFQGDGQQSAESGIGNVSLSDTATQMTQQLESGAQTALAMEPGQKMGMKRRRPKPSTLREMNFWAPTSM